MVSCWGGLAIMAQEANYWDPGSIPGRDTSFDVPESSCLLSGPGLQLVSRYTNLLPQVFPLPLVSFVVVVKPYMRFCFCFSAVSWALAHACPLSVRPFYLLFCSFSLRPVFASFRIVFVTNNTVFISLQFLFDRSRFQGHSVPFSTLFWRRFITVSIIVF